MNLIIEAFMYSYGNKIPKKYTCDDENITPGLKWENVPEGVKSFAIIMEDPDVKSRSTPFVHWVVYNIAGEIRQFETGVVPEKVKQGTNDFGKIGYQGPCPEPSADHHRYFVKLYALDTMLDLPEGATKQELVRAMKNHILAEHEVIGFYERNK
jgi:Raf kinase inhibitor-like YbhB/YbcL family protein